MNDNKSEKPYCKVCRHNCWVEHVKKCEVKDKPIDEIKKDEMRKCADFSR